jgi:hypothetical protein
MCEKLKSNSSADFENVDTPILYIEKFDEYGLKIYDSGSSSIEIEFCPWCGQKLPESKRDQWFEEIEQLGIDPWSNDIPEKYLNDSWYRNHASS